MGDNLSTNAARGAYSFGVSETDTTQGKEAMAPVLKIKPTMMPPREEDVDYVPPRRFVVDAETAARIEDRLANPRKPNDALRALFKK